MSGLERLPGLGPNVAVELARYLSLPTPPSACDTNISSLPGEKRSLQAASPYAVTAHVVFGLWVNGSLFRHKLHLLLMVATPEKEKALQFTFWRISEVSLKRLQKVNGYLEPSWLCFS